MTGDPRRGTTNASDPHASQPVATAGPAPEPDESMLSLYAALDLPSVAAIAPRAAGHTWYPHSFLSPIEANQPFLDSALRRVESVVNDLLARGVPSERIALLGFSQGACLTTEYAARHPRHYGAVIALTGGLIGPPGTPRRYTGSFAGTPVFLGTSDPDPHVPFERVQETATVLANLGAAVDLRRYPGMPHTVNQEELDAARTLVQRVVDRGRERS
jgi:phospholipase/carboxylesterase